MGLSVLKIRYPVTQFVNTSFKTSTPGDKVTNSKTNTEFVVKAVPAGGGASEFRQSMTPHPLVQQELPHDRAGVYPFLAHYHLPGRLKAAFQYLQGSQDVFFHYGIGSFCNAGIRPQFRDFMFRLNSNCAYDNDLDYEIIQFPALN